MAVRDGGSSVAHRVLIVEDDAEVLGTLRALLQQNGCEVLGARNGAEAMAALSAPESELPHVVILDLGLPLEGGVSVLHFLRKVMGSTMPVIVLTGRAYPDEEEAVRELGVSEYLHKPASSETILSAIARALE